MMKLSSFNTNTLSGVLRIFAILPFALIARLWKRNIWIITERPDQARDNGFIFFRYLRTEHPEINAYYIIDKKSPDYEKIRSLGNIIQFGSWKHCFYSVLAEIHISSHVGGCFPDNCAPVLKRLKPLLGYKIVFLPHGVSYGISEFCLKKYTKIDLFICSGEPEYQNILKNYGYSESEVAYTGFPRLDIWHDVHEDEKTILVMPTWRLYLAQNPETKITETVYFKAWQSFLKSQELSDFLKKNKLKLIFYLHHNMRIYSDSFQTDSPDIEIVRDDKQYDIQELLKKSALLITDYSSVHFDFAYMDKPVICYQFDKEEFFTRQYQKASFDAAKDGFGPVTDNLSGLLELIADSYRKKRQTTPEYHHRMRTFYKIHDSNNCRRCFEKILELST